MGNMYIQYSCGRVAHTTLCLHGNDSLVTYDTADVMAAVAVMRFAILGVG